MGEIGLHSAATGHSVDRKRVGGAASATVQWMTFRRSRIGENAHPEDRNNIGAGDGGAEMPEWWLAAEACTRNLAELVYSGRRCPGNQTVVVVSFRLIA